MTFGKFNVDYEQRIYNPERMRKYRLDRAHAMLKKHGLGAMVMYDFDNFRYLGYWSWHNYQRRRPMQYLLLVRDNGFPYCAVHSTESGEYQLEPWLRDKWVLHPVAGVQADLSYDVEWTVKQWAKQAEEIKTLLKQHHVADLPVGIDCHFGLHSVDSLRNAGITLVDGNPAMAEARSIKNEDEIECIKTAASIVEAAHWEVCKALRPGVTEWQMVGVAAKACYDGGAEELEGPQTIACSGPRMGRYGVGTGTDRVIRPGELFTLDINGVSFQGYRTCFYRTFCVGDKPTEKQKAVYHECAELQQIMQDCIKPGITNYEYARAVMEKGPEKYVGNLEWEGKKWGPTLPEPGYYYSCGGHSLGLNSGDPGPTPRINSRELSRPPWTFNKNMVIATDLGVREWSGNQWLEGVKIECVGLVTDTGIDPFYRFPYKDLITVGLPGLY